MLLSNCIFFLVASLVHRLAASEPDSFAVSYHVIENKPPGTLIGNLLVDSNLESYYTQDARQVIYFEILAHSSRYDKFFTMDGRGLLRTKVVLDRDDLCHDQDDCDIHLDLAIQPIEYFNILKVVLHIVDLNDNAPSFPAPELELEISETAVLDSQFVLPVAEDADSGVFGIQGYRLLGADSGVFKLSVIHNLGGLEDVSLILKQKLDREGVNTYQLKVSVDAAP